MTKKRKRRSKRSATDELCDRHAEKLGELIACELKIAYLTEPWWRWTCSLQLAMIMQRAILPHDKRQLSRSST